MDFEAGLGSFLVVLYASSGPATAGPRRGRVREQGIAPAVWGGEEWRFLIVRVPSDVGSRACAVSAAVVVVWWLKKSRTGWGRVLLKLCQPRNCHQRQAKLKYVHALSSCFTLIISLLLK